MWAGSVELADTQLNLFWLLGCTLLVALMQAGFCCLESGLVRSKNSINVALKNLIDFCVTSTVFWVAGFGLMFGATVGGVFGSDRFLIDADRFSPATIAFFLFQLMFCSTAATIVSGAVAERMRLAVYVLLAVTVSLIVYPLVGHWVWHGLDRGVASGWLAALGFRDFAGATVVHSVGGWTALAAVLVIGPRTGRFDGKQDPIPGHDQPMATLGVFLLWLGWFGFNGGSLLTFDGRVVGVLLNTTLASSFGGIAAFSIAAWHLRRCDVHTTMNGILAGLVAITGSANCVSALDAAVIGMIGGLVCFLASLALVRWRIDDVVGAVPVHLAAGIWGTLAVAIFGEAQLLQSGLGIARQLFVQLMGIAVVGAWSFSVTYLALRIAQRFMTLRVTTEQERLGLNVSEHGAQTEQFALLRQMQHQRVTGDFSQRVQVEPHTEVGSIAAEYNRVLDAVEAKSSELQQAVEELQHANHELDEMTFIASHDLQEPVRTLVSFSSLLKEDIGYELNEKAERDLGFIVKSALRMKLLVQDLLSLTRVGRESVDISPFSLDEAVDAALDTFRSELRASGAEVRRDHLPIVNGCSKLIATLYEQLIDNALKFAATEPPIIHLTATQQSGEWIFGVRDNGIGMESKQANRIFQPFQRLHRRDEYSGNGIGLSIARKVVSRHGGRLWVETQLGQGSFFQFTLGSADTELSVAATRPKTIANVDATCLAAGNTQPSA